MIETLLYINMQYFQLEHVDCMFYFTEQERIYIEIYDTMSIDKLQTLLDCFRHRRYTYIQIKNTNHIVINFLRDNRIYEGGIYLSNVHPKEKYTGFAISQYY